MKKSEQKVPVTEKALYQRINRRLKPDEETLKKSRSNRMFATVGTYYVVDLKTNAVSRLRVDLEEFGRELGALQPFEALTEE